MTLFEMGRRGVKRDESLIDGKVKAADRENWRIGIV